MSKRFSIDNIFSSKIPDGALEGEDAEELLGEADQAFPDSDFVTSVWDWFDEKGFITERQAEGLRRVRDGE